MSEEFKNNGHVDLRIPSPEQAKEVAEIWGEGYEPLVNIVETCIKNQIQTFACCSGHKDGDVSYIYFNDSQAARYVLNKMANDDLTRSVVIGGVHGGVAFHCIYKNREAFFNKINGHLQGYLSKEKITIKKPNTTYSGRFEQKNENLLQKMSIASSKNKGFMVEYSPDRQKYRNKFTTGWVGSSKITRILKREYSIDLKKIEEPTQMIDKVKSECSESQIGMSRILSVREKLNRVIEKLKDPEKEQSNLEDRG